MAMQHGAKYFVRLQNIELEKFLEILTRIASQDASKHIVVFIPYLGNLHDTCTIMSKFQIYAPNLAHTLQFHTFSPLTFYKYHRWSVMFAPVDHIYNAT